MNICRLLNKPLLPALVLPMLLACAQPPIHEGCGHQPVQLTAELTGFSGRVGSVQIHLDSERTGSSVASFPDSNLHIRTAGAHCEAEGGVWQRFGVHVAGDGQTVAAIESSGSNDVLVFFSAADCQRVGQIVVSDSRWQFVDRAVEITPAAGADRTPRRHRLNADCRPMAVN